MKEKEPTVVLGADHAGYKYKEKLKKFLLENGIEYEDYGAFEESDNDDYPVYAFKVAEKVSKNKGYLGILLCGTGGGMIIAANKVKGIRAVESYSVYTARMSKLHNNANILGLGARTLSFDKIKKIVNVWLRTEFSGEEKHQRRIKEIEKYEQ